MGGKGSGRKKKVSASRATEADLELLRDPAKTPVPPKPDPAPEKLELPEGWGRYVCRSCGHELVSDAAPPPCPKCEGLMGVALAVGDRISLGGRAYVVQRKFPADMSTIVTDEPPPAPDAERDDLLDAKPPAGPPPVERLPSEDNIICAVCGSQFPESTAQRFLDVRDGLPKLRCVDCVLRAAATPPAPEPVVDGLPVTEDEFAVPEGDLTTPFDVFDEADPDSHPQDPDDAVNEIVLAEATARIRELEAELAAVSTALEEERTERAANRHAIEEIRNALEAAKIESGIHHTAVEAARTRAHDLEVLLGMESEWGGARVVEEGSIEEWVLDLVTTAVTSFPRELDEHALVVSVADVVQQALARRTLEVGRQIAANRETAHGQALDNIALAARMVERRLRELAAIATEPQSAPEDIEAAVVGPNGLDEAWTAVHAAGNIARAAVLAERERFVVAAAERRKALKPVAGDRKIVIGSVPKAG